jgi:pantoate--beta-alanine ligase
MLVFNTISLLKEQLTKIRRQGNTIGFVPTMGALHEGHISLINRSKNETDYTVCSIFVNPAQFNNAADLEKYPRTVTEDSIMLEKAGCDILFLPSDAEMYPQVAQIRISFGELENVMEGKFRPGHFAGVGLVVSKLFHITVPDKAFFGQKDLQQCAVISCLINDLNFPLELVICPTIREKDGLAMSSRNRRLLPEFRKEAPILYQKLREAEKMLSDGEKPEKVQQIITEYFLKRSDIQLEYFEIADFHTLKSVKEIYPNQKIALCIAAFFGEIRLIDNIIF